MDVAELMMWAVALCALAMPILALALVAAMRVAWSQARMRSAAEDAIRSLNRRLADVEAIRRTEASPIPTMIREHLGDEIVGGGA